MPAYTTDAFVLRRMHFGETDNILTLYSPDRGRFSAIAKGARKAISRLSGATEVLTLTRFGLASGKSLEIVTQVEVQELVLGPAARPDPAGARAVPGRLGGPQRGGPRAEPAAV